MNKLLILALVMTAAFGATVTNQQAYACINEVTVPDQLSFTFTYAVQCNQFHNGLVNSKTSSSPVDSAAWKKCQTSLKSVQGVPATVLSSFVNAVTSCTTKGAPALEAAAAVSNKVAYACIQTLTVPSEVQFAFDMGVDCNKFHNGLVNSATANNAVTVANWTTCKKTLSSHFSSAEDKAFYTAIDSCVASGKASVTLQAKAVTNEAAEACIEQLTIPTELTFAFNYDVNCNKFHNGLVNTSTATQAVAVANWTVCKTILKSHFTDAEAKTFYSNVDSCVSNGTPAVTLEAAAVSNKVAYACVQTLTVPSEVQFAFDMGVDCNKFHNGLVNAATANNAVTVANWTTCKKTLSSHFSSAEDKAFYTAIDSCVATGKATVTLKAAAVTNKVAEACVETVTLPQELSFAFNYAVDCNKFHNGLVNASTANQAVTVDNWTVCRGLLEEHFTDDEAEAFYKNIDSCVATGKATVTLKAAAVNNSVASACIDSVSLPQELTFAFNYAVDCNKFHNGLVNAATANQPVTVSNWTVCRKLLADNFTDDEANAFYANVDSCVATGKPVTTLSAAAAAVSNSVAETCIESVALPQELTFAFNYAVDCNKFHNGLVNAATASQPVTVSNWTVCRKLLADNFTDAEAETFYTNVDSCVATGKAAVTLKASAVTNKVANACIESVTLPQELTFAFNYAVDCNKFHNGLVNASTANQPVTVSNWTVCKGLLEEHFTDAEAEAFYADVDSCVASGKKSSSFLKSSKNIAAKIAAFFNY